MAWNSQRPTYPDAVLAEVQRPGRVRVVAEFKTPWPARLDRLSPRRMACLLGMSTGPFNYTMIDQETRAAGKVHG